MVFSRLTGYATSLARTSRSRSSDREHVLPSFDCARFAQVAGLSAVAADVAWLDPGHAPHAARQVTLVRKSRLESEFAHRKRSDSEQRDRTIDASMDDVPVDGEPD